MRVLYLLGFALCLSLSAIAQTQTIWTGQTSTDWFNASNWTNGLPASGKNAVIPTTPTGPNMPKATNFLYINFQIQNSGIIELNGGTSNENNIVNFNGGCIKNNSYFTNTGTLSFDNQGKFFNYNGFANYGTVNQSGTGVWNNQSGSTFYNGTNGNFQNNGNFVNEGSFTNDGYFYTGFCMTIKGWATNNKTIIISSGSGKIIVESGAGITNNPNSTIDVQGLYDNKGYTENKGSFRISSPGTVQNTGNFVNKGVTRNAGLTVNNGSFYNGCSTCDTTGITFFNDYGGIFRNNLVFDNYSTLELLPCSKFYQQSAWGWPVSGPVWLMGIVYQIQGTVNQSNIMGGIVLTNVNAVPTPVATCKNITVNLDGSGQATITPAMINNGSQGEYCGSVTLAASKTSFNCTNAGDNLVTLTVTDGAGTSATCQATVTVIASSYCGSGTCNNLTSPGSIGYDQTGCAPFDPALISSVSLPSGGTGAIEYVWIKWTQDPAVYPDNYTMVPGANGPTYDPGPLTQTTWFRRCARRVGCSDFVGESNNIKITVLNTAPTAICKSFTTSMTGSSITITAADINNGSTAGCGSITNMTVSPATFTAAGTYNVTLSVTNSNGLTATCTSSVTILTGSPVVTCTGNMVTNGSFENGLTGWWTYGTTTVQSSMVNSGTKALSNCDASGGGAGQSVSATAGKTYTARVYAKISGVAGWNTVAMKFMDINWQPIGTEVSKLVNTTAFAEYTLTGVAPASTAYVQVYFWKGNDGCIYVDDWCLTESTSQPVCSNVTNPGSISGDQTVCSGGDPSVINSVSLPSGGSGTVEYVWIKWTVDPAVYPNNYTVVAGATGATYDPGPLTQTTWFRRCARSYGCTDYVGESNNVKITVVNTPPTAYCQPATVTLSGGTASITAASVNNGSTPGCGTIQSMTVSQTTFTAPGSYSVTLTVTNSNGLTSTCTTTVTVNPAPTTCSNVTNAGSIAGDQTICLGGDPTAFTSVALPSGGSTAAIEYVWLQWTVDPALYPNSYTVIAGATGATYDAGPLTQTTWFRRCARRSGCTDYVGESNIIKVIVANTPPTAFCKSATLTLSGSSVALNANDINNGSTAGCGTISSITATPNSFTAAGVYNVTLTVTNSNGLSATCIAQVTVQSATPVCSNVTNAGSIAGDQTICLGGDPAAFTSVALPSGGSTATIEYVWLKWTVDPALYPNSYTVIAGATGATYDAGPLTQTTWFRRCARRSGCTDYIGESNIIKVTVVNTPPTAFCKSATLTLSGSSVALNANDINNGSTAGCGTISSITATPNSFTAAGVYNVTLTVTNSNGLSSTCIAQVTVLSATPVCSNVTNAGSIDGDQTICLGGDPAAFTSVALPSGGSTATIEYVWLKWTVDPALYPNSYTVIAGATGATYDAGPLTQTTWFRRCARRSGCTDYIGESNIIKVTVVNTPPTAFCKSATLTLSGSSVALNANDINNGSTAGCGTISSITATPNSFTAAGVYNVTLTVTNSNGLSSTCIAQVTVQSATPVCSNVTNAGSIAGNQAICVNIDPNIITSTALPSGGSTAAIEYVWLSWTVDPAIYPNSYTVVPGANGPTYDPGVLSQTTWFRRCARRAGCTDYVGESNIVKIEIINIAPLIFCKPATVTLVGGVATITNADIEDMSSGGCGTIVSRTVTPNSFSAPGVYNVTLSVVNNYGLTASCVAQVTVLSSTTCSNLTSAGEIAGSQTVCTTDDPTAFTSVSLPSGGSGTIEYVWIQWTSDPALYPNTSSVVSGANGATYDSGPLTQTTWFRRCARRSGCSDFVGESNIIKVTVTTCSTCNKTALFVVGNTTLCSGDYWIKTRLQQMGISVTIKSGINATASHAYGKGLVLISSSVNSVDVNTKFKDVAVPVITWESQLYDDMCMTGTVNNVDYGGNSGRCGYIANSSHPLAAGLSGTIYYYGSNMAERYGLPSSNAIKVMNFCNYSNQWGVFGYETGANMVGKLAPARRVGLFLEDNSAPSLNLNGRKLFDCAVKWAMNCSTLPNLGASIADNPLVFNAYKKEYDVQLKWINNTGEINDYFTVERSANGIDFEDILKVDGHGPADEYLYFNELDKQPLEGDNYYRLRLTMLDGDELYSEVMKIRFEKLTPFELFPNPAGDAVNLEMKAFAGKPAIVELVNQLGVVVKTFQFDNVTEEPVRLGLLDVDNGFYQVVITSEGIRRANRLVVSRLY